jgi:hypothetical protein
MKMKTLPHDWPDTMTGRQLLEDGYVMKAKICGFVWPYDWQILCGGHTWTDVGITEHHVMCTMKYRINPDRLMERDDE